jgi:hypothetical protein
MEAYEGQPNDRSPFIYRVWRLASSSINWCKKSLRIKMITGIWISTVIRIDKFLWSWRRVQQLYLPSASTVLAASITTITLLWKAEGMSQTLREFSTRHCLICQLIVLGRLCVTPEFGTTAKETAALTVCVRTDESGHAEKMKSFLTTFT